MTEGHPDGAALQRFMRGDLEREERLPIVRHLLGGCAHCVAITRNFWSLGAPAGAPALPVAEGGAAGEPREKEGLSPRQERRAAAARLVELYALPVAARAERIVEDERFHLAALCRLLLNDLPSFPAGDERVANAELAAALAERVAPARSGIVEVAALRARSWAQVAWARRATGDLPGAEKALARAEVQLSPPLRGSVEEGELLELRALGSWDRDRAAEAEAAMAGAVSIYRAAGPAAGGRRRLGRALVRQGILRSRLGDGRAAEAASGLLKEGLAILKAETDPRFAASALHWLGVLRAEAGAGSEALALLQRARDLYAEVGDLENQARVWFAEGMIGAEEGRSEESDRALLEAERGFLEIGSGRSAAQVLLQRTLHGLRRGRAEEIRCLGAQILPILRCGGLSRGDSAALLLFRQLVEGARATEGFLAEVVRFLAGNQPVRRPASDPPL